MVVSASLLDFALTARGQQPRLTPAASDSHPILGTGSSAPEFPLPGTDDKVHKLGERGASLWRTSKTKLMPVITPTGRPSSD